MPVPIAPASQASFRDALYHELADLVTRLAIGVPRDEHAFHRKFAGLSLGNLKAARDNVEAALQSLFPPSELPSVPSV